MPRYNLRWDHFTAILECASRGFKKNTSNGGGKRGGNADLKGKKRFSVGGKSMLDRLGGEKEVLRLEDN